VAIIVVAFLSATIVLPKFNYSLIVIKSGSMEPTIKTGSVLLSKKQDNYQKGDIITFVKVGKEIVTHRIVEVNADSDFVEYKTKGDANDVVDNGTVKKGRILGKKILAIPYLGYVIAFLKSKIGIIVLIIIPAGYFIGQEIMKIGGEIKKRKQNSQIK